MFDDVELERRLLEMGRWYQTKEDGGFISFTPIYSMVLSEGGYRESSIPVGVGTAWETHNAVLSLFIDYRLALLAHYCREGPRGEKLRDKNQVEIAEKYLGCSERTYRRRLEEGRLMVKAELRRIADAANRPYLTVANR